MARVIEAFKKFMNKAGTASLDGGYLLFKESGLDTKKDTYSDSAETIANTNPLQLTSEEAVKDGGFYINADGESFFVLLVDEFEASGVTDTRANIYRIDLLTP